MQINTSFDVPLPRERAWDALLDVEDIAPCMPGATLDGRDGDTYRGRVKLKIGPILAQYAGTVTITETDAAAGRLALRAKGKEQRGSGTADATVVARLSEAAGATRVEVETTLNVTGRAAQFGRSVMQDVAKRLVTTFAGNLAAMLSERGAEPAGGPAAGEPARADGTAPADGARTPAPAPRSSPAPRPGADDHVNVLALLAASPRVRAGVLVLVVLALAALSLWIGL